ncbi:antirestriction protein [Seongchinamella unica]|uniref:Antirestriction protein n=1 Tax=Seongchinamella unica TaxID=2547392 RepID=A0A4R5LNH8_9GAMM|nr:antirestriction protein [Seongchinamella unica]TDG11655.1 antirestriction protein [Seongchinamella unica]
MSDTHAIRSTLVPEDQRLDITADLFGAHFPLRLEPVIYGITDRMAPEYHGGYWHFYALDNGGFYMAPDNDKCFLVQSSNCWQGELSADALGITACLATYSHLSFSGDPVFSRTCAEHYHLLREFIYQHPEVAAILGAID